jgi:hypothetical protein
MFRPRDSTGNDHERDGFIALVKETADGLGRLIADHIKLARTEIVADAKSYGRDVGVVAAGVFVLALGYAFAWVAVALALRRVIGGPLAFAAIAALHLVAGAIGVAAAARAMRRTPPLLGTRAEVSRSVAALSAPPLGLHTAEAGLHPSEAGPDAHPVRQLQTEERPL